MTDKTNGVTVTDDANEEMTAITTMPNAIPAGKGTVMIYSSKNRILRLELRKNTGEQLASFGDTTAGLSVPKLANPSSLVALQHNNIICVYGVIGDSADSLKTALLSPVYQPLTSGKQKTGSLAGVTSTDGTRFLYYQGANSKIMQYNPDSDEFKPLNTQAILSGTRLFAFRHERENWIIYQQGNNSISLYNIRAQKESPVPNSTTAKPKTPITATVVPAVGSRKARVYIYYTNNDGNVVGANSAMAETLSFVTNDEKPSQTLRLGEGQSTISAEPFSQLSVERCEQYPVPDDGGEGGKTATDCNVLYVQTTDSGKVVGLPCDKWQPSA